jgi:hypothetical protein
MRKNVKEPRALDNRTPHGRRCGQLRRLVMGNADLATDGRLLNETRLHITSPGFDPSRYNPTRLHR